MGIALSHGGFSERKAIKWQMISCDQLKNKQINSKLETMMRLESAVEVEPFVGKVTFAMIKRSRNRPMILIQESKLYMSQ
jgi:hypothetical protein